MPTAIRLIPIHLIFNPSLIVFVMNPKICSTLARIRLFLQLQEKPDPSEGGAYLWVHDEHDEGRVEDEVDRDETDCGGHRTVKSRLQHGPVRTDHTFEVGVSSVRGLETRLENNRWSRKRPKSDVPRPAA